MKSCAGVSESARRIQWVGSPSHVVASQNSEWFRDVATNTES
jgi:hypothetical protein